MGAGELMRRGYLGLVLAFSKQKNKCSHSLNFLAYSRREDVSQFDESDPNEVEFLSSHREGT